VVPVRLPEPFVYVGVAENVTAVHVAFGMLCVAVEVNSITDCALMVVCNSVIAVVWVFIVAAVVNTPSTKVAGVVAIGPQLGRGM
jgi:hypothetical protein